MKSMKHKRMQLIVVLITATMIYGDTTENLGELDKLKSKSKESAAQIMAQI